MDINKRLGARKGAKKMNAEKHENLLENEVL